MRTTSLPAPLDLKVEKSAERTLLTLAGELDAATASYLYNRLAELEVDGAANVVLDLAQVNFMDSSGIGVIVTAYTRLKRSGGTLTIFSPTSSVRRLLEMTGLSRAMEILPATDER